MQFNNFGNYILHKYFLKFNADILYIVRDKYIRSFNLDRS